MHATFLLLALFAACDGGAIVLEEDTGTATDDTATGDTDETATDDTDDTDETANAWTGAYTGALALSVADPRGSGERMEVCTGSVDLSVDAAGALSGTGECTGIGGPGGPGGPGLLFTFEGAVTEGGEADGAVTHAPGDAPPEAYDFVGTFNNDGVAMIWFGELTNPMGDVVEFQGAVQGR